MSTSSNQTLQSVNLFTAALEALYSRLRRDWSGVTGGDGRGDAAAQELVVGVTLPADNGGFSSPAAVWAFNWSSSSFQQQMVCTRSVQLTISE